MIVPTIPPPPDLRRDCPECQAPEGMELQNVTHTAPINIPLLYICESCGSTLTIPPQLPIIA